MIIDAKNYAVARMLALGYVEHKDPLNTENIPQQLQGRAFHVMIQEPRGISNNQNSQDIEVDFAVRLWLKGKIDVNAARDEALTKLETIIAAFVAPMNRLNATGLKNVVFRSGGIDPIAGSNDNAFVVRTEWTARTVMSTS
jgi:hypothetical protein